jgi:predicted transcriptional regulator
MDKILSTRLDESVVHRITHLARELKTSKKQVIESAIRLFAAKVEGDLKTDIFLQTFASWERKESAEQIITKGREKFNRSMRRHAK